MKISKTLLLSLASFSLLLGACTPAAATSSEAPQSSNPPASSEAPASSQTPASSEIPVTSDDPASSEHPIPSSEAPASEEELTVKQILKNDAAANNFTAIVTTSTWAGNYTLKYNDKIIEQDAGDGKKMFVVLDNDNNIKMYYNKRVVQSLDGYSRTTLDINFSLFNGVLKESLADLVDQLPESQITKDEKDVYHLPDIGFHFNLDMVSKMSQMTIDEASKDAVITLYNVAVTIKDNHVATLTFESGSYGISDGVIHVEEETKTPGSFAFSNYGTTVTENPFGEDEEPVETSSEEPSGEKTLMSQYRGTGIVETDVDYYDSLVQLAQSATFKFYSNGEAELMTTKQMSGNYVADNTIITAGVWAEAKTGMTFTPKKIIANYF